ncbi:N-acetylglucosamine-6-sulfatase-like [Copidosoma floridanum]|uniref:N-acetylglucosamine-6-sulfatase-like n=1 Tax=Copidosoma floridanum TaxID=29053 RepID=UPI0006C9E57B|nr:N-acetylglucosamine-6-sulfatase-like [Copidosoma floridanum]
MYHVGCQYSSVSASVESFRACTSKVAIMLALNLLVFTIGAICACHAKNIVLIVADDLDVVLDGMTPLASTRKYIGDEGVTFKNAFAAVPICCPNRASILTGRYQHNHRTFNNSLNGGCNAQDWLTSHETNTFAAILKHQMNYSTFYAGKYLNQYGDKNTGGASHVPPGWDQWYGLIGNSRYYNYSLSVNGVEKKYGAEPSDYLTDVIKTLALDYISRQRKDHPFMMVLAPPAPHHPFVPAERHNDKYKGTRAKLTKNFNTWTNQEKHWLVRMGPSPLPSNVLASLDEIYRRRWEALLAVDEMVADVHDQLAKQGLLDDTYVIFTSDNGFHVGQFSQPYDKRQPYEADIRVPLLVRGPNVTRATEFAAAVSSVDLFATIIEMAGVEAPSDGISLLKLLRDGVKDRTVLVEYRGERSIGAPSSGCPSDRDLNLSHCSREFACKCQDAANNTFACVRRVAERENNVFCVFNEDEGEFVEAYDLLSDEFQMTNVGPAMGANKRHRFRDRLRKMTNCKGRNCVATNPPLHSHLDELSLLYTSMEDHFVTMI